ncbi:MAG: epoxide hydrolase [Aromatoleum sp.]|jgi:pimeloyl-ACP methyl ester carboxylesterase|uniref:epoxide hydrolase family protein n=1 Tax=Aromatoleum sp. TaxID=2307007 RepID=UPI00289447DE|nr:epoxide hydrolase [Aromatoleum sp.]MDT3671234.1 epoxide hydrolase [Aromatoleum sp.]
MSDSIHPFTLNVREADLDDLRRRLAATRWPDRETVDDWAQGAPLDRVRALVDYWRTDYDWRRCEAMLNSLGQYRTEIDGLGIHFLHVRSPHPGAMPLIMTHGWPGSVIEFHKVIGPLTDPVAHGGSAADAFHVVAPSLPGYGFSDKPTRAGCNIARIAEMWAELMRRLGYERYVAQGGDWGSAVTTALGAMRAPGLAAIHLNTVMTIPPKRSDNPDAAEKAAWDAIADYQRHGAGYSKQQSTRPQTLAYGLADSPAGQAAWIYEKFREWADCDGMPENVFSRDELLDNIMLYWLPNNAASAARLYWESFRERPRKVDLPVGCSLFPRELSRPPRAWAEAMFSKLIHWNAPPRGGHFPAFEQPGLFVEEVRNCFRSMRTTAPAATAAEAN